MSRSLNKVTLIGNLGADPEIRTTPNGSKVAQFSLATSRSWGGQGGSEKQEKTEWHRVVAWRHLAERAERYLKKGKQVYVEGRLETRKWTGQDGADRYTTEVIAQQLMLLGRREDNESAGVAAAPAASGNFNPPPIDAAPAEDDDLPF